MNLDDLKRPFPPDAVKWRVGSTNKDKTRGMALAYIDARDVMDRLDKVCGPQHWSSSFSEAAGRVICSISIRCLMPYPDPLGKDDNRQCYGWVHKADGSGDTDFEGEKGGISSAFKRAAVHWGIGRYLYDIPATWVAIGPMGKSYQIDATELPKLRRLLTQHASGAPTVPRDAQGDADGYHPAPHIPAPAGEAPRPIDGMAEIERWRQKAAMLDNIGDLATMDAWFHKNGAKHFGERAGEAGAILQARLDELRAQK